MQKSGKISVKIAENIFMKRSVIGSTRQQYATARFGRKSTLIHGADGADEFGEVSAVARGLIERFEARVGEGFGKSDPARERTAGEDELVPLNRRDLIVETRDGASAEKRARCFRRGEDRGLNLFFFHAPSNRSPTSQLVIQTGLKIDIVLLEIARL